MCKKGVTALTSKGVCLMFENRTVSRTSENFGGIRILGFKPPKKSFNQSRAKSTPNNMDC